MGQRITELKWQKATTLIRWQTDFGALFSGSFVSSEWDRSYLERTVDIKIQIETFMPVSFSNLHLNSHISENELYKI